MSLKSYVCPKCDKEFDCSGKLDLHVQAIHNRLERPFRCTWPGCQVKKAQRDNLLQHVVKEHFEAGDCTRDPAQFMKDTSKGEQAKEPNNNSNHSSLETNKSNHQQVSLPPSLPKQQPSPGPSSGGERSHDVVQDTKKDARQSVFVCGFQRCKEEFALKEKLRIHLRIVHFKLKPYSCSWRKCRFKSSTQKKILNHIKVLHTKDRPERYMEICKRTLKDEKKRFKELKCRIKLIEPAISEKRNNIGHNKVSNSQGAHTRMATTAPASHSSTQKSKNIEEVSDSMFTIVKSPINPNADLLFFEGSLFNRGYSYKNSFYWICRKAHYGCKRRLTMRNNRIVRVSGEHADHPLHSDLDKALEEMKKSYAQGNTTCSVDLTGSLPFTSEKSRYGNDIIHFRGGRFTLHSGKLQGDNHWYRCSAKNAHCSARVYIENGKIIKYFDQHTHPLSESTRENNNNDNTEEMITIDQEESSDIDEGPVNNEELSDIEEIPNHNNNDEPCDIEELPDNVDEPCDIEELPDNDDESLDPIRQTVNPDSQSTRKSQQDNSNNRTNGSSIVDILDGFESDDSAGFFDLPEEDDDADIEMESVVGDGESTAAASQSVDDVASELISFELCNCDLSNLSEKGKVVHRLVHRCLSPYHCQSPTCLAPSSFSLTEHLKHSCNALVLKVTHPKLELNDTTEKAIEVASFVRKEYRDQIGQLTYRLAPVSEEQNAKFEQHLKECIFANSPEKPLPFQCGFPECPFSFGNRNDLNVHIEFYHIPFASGCVDQHGVRYIDQLNLVHFLNRFKRELKKHSLD